MALLAPAKIQTGYLKAGFLGFAGSGKTHTAMLVATGLLKATNDQRPIAMVDTEAGSDWWVERLRREGFDMLVAKTRAFADLLAIGQEAEGQCSILIVDSISHIWKELLEAYQNKFNVSRLAFHHWNVIKPEWNRFTDWFLNSQIHCVICGRAGYEYDYEEDEEGHRELVKTGTKMKAESEFGFEPSLLVEMVRLKHSFVKKDPDLKGWIHRAYVLKDRSDQMNGAEIDNPTYESFLPHMEAINVGGEHHIIDSERRSDEMFDDRDHSAIRRKREVNIALEEIKECFIIAGVGSQAKEDKLEMTNALIIAFGTSSWTAITSMNLEKLQQGLHILRGRYNQLPTPSPGKETHGPLKVSLDALIVPPEQAEEAKEEAGQPELPMQVQEAIDEYEIPPEEEMEDEEEPLEGEPTKRAEYRKLFKLAFEQRFPNASREDRIKWQIEHIGKLSQREWTVVDYIHALAEVQSPREEEEE